MVFTEVADNYLKSKASKSKQKAEHLSLAVQKKSDTTKNKIKIQNEKLSIQNEKFTWN